MARQSPYRRYYYDDDLPSSTHMLWLVVVVILLAVGSFLFGRYVLGERLRQGASPVRNVAQQPPVLQGSQPSPSAPEVAPTVTIVSDQEELPEGREKPAAEASESISPVGSLDSRAAAASGEPFPRQEPPPRPERSLPAEGEERPAARRPVPSDLTPQALQEARKRLEPGGERPRLRGEMDRLASSPKAEPLPSKATLPSSRQVKAETPERIAKEHRTTALSRPSPKEQAAPPPPSSPPSTKEPMKRSDLPPRPPGAPARPAPKPPEKPDSEPAKVASTPAEKGSEPAAGKLFRLRSGVFANRENADRQVEKLRASGHDTWIRVIQRNGQTYYEVQVGAYSDKKRAEEERAKLAAEGHEVSVSEE